MAANALRALVLDTNISAFGVDAVVTRPYPDTTPITTQAIWITAEMDAVPDGFEVSRREPRKILAFSRADVPTLPRGSFISAPEHQDADPQRWRVDGFDREEPEHWRVVVVSDPDEGLE